MHYCPPMRTLNARIYRFTRTSPIHPCRKTTQSQLAAFWYGLAFNHVSNWMLQDHSNYISWPIFRNPPNKHRLRLSPQPQQCLREGTQQRFIMPGESVDPFTFDVDSSHDQTGRMDYRLNHLAASASYCREIAGVCSHILNDEGTLGGDRSTVEAH